MRRDGVPRLGRAVVQVIDTVQVHILRVPRERRLPHSKVEVRRVDALDLDVVHRVENGAEAIDVPVLLVGVGDGTGYVGAVDRRVERQVLPILALQVVVVLVIWRAISANKSTNFFFANLLTRMDMWK